MFAFSSKCHEVKVGLSALKKKLVIPSQILTHYLNWVNLLLFLATCWPQQHLYVCCCQMLPVVSLPWNLSIKTFLNQFSPRL